MESTSKAVLLDLIDRAQQSHGALQRLVILCHYESANAQAGVQEVKERIAELTDILKSLYSFTGGDINHKEDSWIRNIVISQCNGCTKLLTGLQEGLELLQKFSLGELQPYYISNVLASMVAVLRNLGREQVGNDLIFRSNIAFQLLNLLGASEQVPNQFRMCSRFVSSSFGLLWSQCYRPAQCEIILRHVGGPHVFIFLVLDYLNLFRFDPAVYRNGIGLGYAILSIDNINRLGVHSERVFLLIEQILTHLQRGLNQQNPGVLRADSTWMEVADITLLFAQRLTNCVSTTSSTRRCAGELALTFISILGNTRPKTSVFAIAVLENLIQSEAGRASLSQNARIILSRFVDTCGDDNIKQRAVALASKMVQRLVFTPSRTTDHNEVCFSGVPSSALVLQINPASNKLLVGTIDGSLVMLDISYKNKNKILWSYSGLGQPFERPTAVAFSQDGRRCAVGTVRGVLGILVTINGGILFSRQIPLSYQRIWSIEFVDDSTILIGQSERCYAVSIDPRDAQIFQLLPCDRLVSLSRGGQSVFLGAKHERGIRGDEQHFRTRLTIFQVANAATRRRDGKPYLYCEELAVSTAFPQDEAPIIHAFGLSTRFAVLGSMRSTHVALVHATQQVLLADFDARTLFPSTTPSIELETILVSVNGSRLLLIAQDANNVSHVSCVEPLSKKVVFSRSFGKKVRCCSLSQDGSQLYLQLDADDSRIMHIDMFRGDRERLLALCQLSGEYATDRDVLSRVKRFLIG